MSLGPRASGIDGCATTPANSPRQRSSTNERAFVAAGHSGLIRRTGAYTPTFTGTDPQNRPDRQLARDYAGGAFLHKWIAPILAYTLGHAGRARRKST